MVKCIYCGFCQESLPGRCHRRDRHPEFDTETRERALLHKDQLLANGDRWEREIAAEPRADAPYR